MFERFYTTKMSTSGKELRMRFERIRRGKGKLSRLAGTVTAIVMLTVLACGTIAMAAVGADGLEHWDKNEVYFIDGTQTSLSVGGKNVPAWVYEDITDDGNISIALKRYQIRGVDGWVDPMNLIEVRGNKGNMTLMASGVGTGVHTLQEIESNPQNRSWALIGPDKLNIRYKFIEFANEGYSGIWQGACKDFISPISGKYRGINLIFVISDDWSIEKAIIEFTVNDKNDNPSGLEFSYMELPYSNFEDIGFEDNIKDNCIKSSNNCFTAYESGYVNKNVDGINISVSYAHADGIEVNIQNDMPDIRKAEIRVYNDYGATVFTEISDTEKVSGSFEIKPRSEKWPTYMEWEQENEAGQFLSGHTYRIIVALVGNDNRLVYRWQDYVTIP